MGKRPKNIDTLIPFQVNDRWFAVTLAATEGVAPCSSIVSIPGNASRTILGVSYTSGQLATVIDCGPLMNLGRTLKPAHVILIRHEASYYAIFAHQVGQLVQHPRLQKYKKPLFAFAHSYVDIGKKKITVLDTALVINHLLCM